MVEKKRVLTLIEAREVNIRTVNDMRAAAERAGWGFVWLKRMDDFEVARGELDKSVPLEYVLYRDMELNSQAAVAKLKYWLTKQRRAAINVTAVGGQVLGSDKYYQHAMFQMDAVLKEHILPCYEVRNAKEVLALIKDGYLHYPIVLKPRLGTTGKGILLCRDEAELKARDGKWGSSMAVEQYVAPECDWRVFVVGGTAVGMMRKTGDFEHPENFELWSAGKTKVKEENPEAIAILSRIATRAAEVTHLEYVGVDIIKDSVSGKYYLLETNCAAGWQNRFIEITGVKMPEVIMQWLVERGEYLYAGEKLDVVRQANMIEKYIMGRIKYLPEQLSRDYEQILAGNLGVVAAYKSVFEADDAGALWGSVEIFHKLYRAYSEAVGARFVGRARDFGADELQISDRAVYLVDEISELPLSWAGNFIGPNTGTLNEGIILSAMWLYVIKKINAFV